MGATYSWFLANSVELAEALPRWSRPPRPRLPGARKIISNPFTHAPVEVWEFGEPSTASPEELAGPLDLDGLLQFSGRLSVLEFSSLIGAISDEDPAKIFDLLLSQRMMGPEHAGGDVLAIPAELVQRLASLPEDSRAACERWFETSTSAELVRQANEPMPLADTTVRARWLADLRALATEAIRTNREMFVLWQA
jgi:hypothetical protein